MRIIPTSVHCAPLWLKLTQVASESVAQSLPARNPLHCASLLYNWIRSDNKVCWKRTYKKCFV